MNINDIVGKYINEESINENNKYLLDKFQIMFGNKSDTELKSIYKNAFELKKSIMAVIDNANIPSTAKFKYLTNIGKITDWNKLIAFVWSSIVPIKTSGNTCAGTSIDNKYEFSKHKFGN